MVGTESKTRPELAVMDIPADIGAVVVGFDGLFTYAKAAIATRVIRENKGCIFVSTNQDSTFPAAPGVVLPGGGSCVSMIATASGVYVCVIVCEG
jgi:ribonucleotide monophosphatase NagD (HAD superfamily)